MTTANGTFGYVRLFNFQADNIDDISNAMIQAFGSMPGCGLILDLRGNSVGYFAASERILQLLTNRRITPIRFQFRVTTATRAIVEVTDSFLSWRQSMREAAATGEPFSQAYPIEGIDDDFNAIGQKYFGPVVIITDALAFSTADVFVAGVIDHDIGRVVCVDENMAAAGGNNWSPQDVVRLCTRISISRQSCNKRWRQVPSRQPSFKRSIERAPHCQTNRRCRRKRRNMMAAPGGSKTARCGTSSGFCPGPTMGCTSTCMWGEAAWRICRTA